MDTKELVVIIECAKVLTKSKSVTNIVSTKNSNRLSVYLSNCL